jgi:serine O-acetyltransferase
MSVFTPTVRADVNRCLAQDATSSLQMLGAVWRDIGLQAVLVYRLGRLLQKSRRKPLAWPLLPFGWFLYGCGVLLARRGYGIRLALSADIGAGFWVGHFGGTDVADCILGERCSVGQQTKVGAAPGGEGPRVGSGVWIGAHAKIIGPLRVGDSATIAPGARITRNVPPRALVVGDPGRVVFRGYDNTSILPRT